MMCKFLFVWKSVLILIRWLHEMPADLDLSVCIIICKFLLQNQIYTRHVAKSSILNCKPFHCNTCHCSNGYTLLNKMASRAKIENKYFNSFLARDDFCHLSHGM